VRSARYARIAESDCPVLILGEHGAGKRFVAAQIHAQSHLSRSAFLEIRCFNADASTLQAAVSTHGTVYLAEITDLSLSMQELIVNSYFRSEQVESCRLLCGSSRDLPREVKSWRMREDFYYYVSAMTLQIPRYDAGSQRFSPLPMSFWRSTPSSLTAPSQFLCKETIGHLLEHTWPGNLFELQTAIKTFVAIGDQAISLAAINAAAQSGRPNGNRRPLLLKEATRASSIQLERQLISEVLISTGGNRKRAAADLGISYKASLYKLKQIETENQSAFCRNGVAQ